jgi:hypothetical protein
VEARRRLAVDEYSEPQDERRDGRRHPPQHQPEEVRDREEEPEEDGQPPPFEVVGDDQAHGGLRGRGDGHESILVFLRGDAQDVLAGEARRRGSRAQ